MLDLEFLRAQFPALHGDTALFDNAGGSAPLRGVIDAVAAYMRQWPVQLGASYSLSVTAGEKVDAGRAAMAALVHADPDEIVLGASTTANVRTLAAALRGWLAPGDEIVVTNLDHESNVGAWRALAEAGVVVREWQFDPASHELTMAGLDAVLTARTRLVCFTHCANIVGVIHDAAAFIRRIHEAGALACVDGVAFAPHRRVDVRALDADFYLVSLYKVFGPHLGLLYGRRDLLRRARGQNHYFIPDDDVPYKLQPGAVPYELVAGLPAIVEYLLLLGAHHGGDPSAPVSQRLEGAFAAIAAHEAELAAPLLAFLAGHPRVRVLGGTGGPAGRRAPTIAFTVEGRHAGEIPPLLDREGLAIRFGHFYAHRAITALGLHERGGVVRISLAHYNAPSEVSRLRAVLEAVL